MNQPASLGSLLTEGFLGFFGFIPVWLFGAVYSALPFISYGAIAAYAFIFVSLASKHPNRKDRVKKALWLIYGLSMVTLWLEPFITRYTIGGAVEQWVTGIFAAFFFPADIAVSVAWFLLTMAVVRRVSDIRGDIKNQFSTDSTDPAMLSVQKESKTAFLYSLVGGGYFYLGQRIKGTLLVIWLLLGLGEPLFLVFGYVLSIIDVRRLVDNQGKSQPLRAWETKINPYTVGIVFTLVSIFILPFT